MMVELTVIVILWQYEMMRSMWMGRERSDRNWPPPIYSEEADPLVTQVRFALSPFLQI